MKYVIELEEIEGTDLYRAKGANTLVFDKNGIENILTPIEIEEEEPKCQFKKGEIVEVSEDNIYWRLCTFSRLTDDRIFKYATKEEGPDECEWIWPHCQKYGTLGGLVKGDE